MPPVTITVLSEDSSSKARPTVLRFIKKAATTVCKECQPQNIQCEPRDEALQKGTVSGNRWRSNKPEHHHELVQLRRYLATRLAMPNTAVFFHFDGDVPWSKRTESTTRRDFEQTIVSTVRQILAQPPRGVAVARSPEEVDACLSRLVLVVPFYSIEAWVYQNTDRILEFCKKKCRSRHDTHRKEITRWAANPDILDELVKPKEKCCLRSTKNHELVDDNFPWPKLEKVRKSFHAFVKELEERPNVTSIFATTAA